MTRFKNNRYGFSFIEAILAVAIVGIVLTPLFLLQGNVIRKIGQWSRYMQRIYEAKNFFIESQRAIPPDTRQVMLEKKIADPEAVLKYEIREIASKSSLRKFKNILVEQVTLEWEQEGLKRQDIVMSFLFKPEPKK